MFINLYNNIRFFPSILIRAPGVHLQATLQPPPQLLLFMLQYVWLNPCPVCFGFVLFDALSAVLLDWNKPIHETFKQAHLASGSVVNKITQFPQSVAYTLNGSLNPMCQYLHIKWETDRTDHSYFTVKYSVVWYLIYSTITSEWVSANMKQFMRWSLQRKVELKTVM